MKWFLTLSALLVLAGCDTPIGSPSSSSSGAGVPKTPPPSIGGGTVTIDESKVRQSIDGFGGATAWQGSLPSDAVIQALFDPATGAGLSIIRNRIPFREDSGSNNDNFIAKTGGHYSSTVDSDHKTFTLNWGNWDLSTTKALFAKAKTYASDLRGFSTAWSPPNNTSDNWKIDDPAGSEGGRPNTVGGATYSNTTHAWTAQSASTYPSVGGILDPNHYQDYADVLADYAKNFEANMGYPLAAVSVQNEPNFLPESYESCWWPDTAFTNFLPKLKSAWTAKGTATPVMAPESFTFTSDLIAGALASNASIGIVGLHQYNALGISDPGSKYDQSQADFNAVWQDAVKSAGKTLWETEVSSTTGGANDSSIQDGLYWARMVHADMTVAEVNAFCAWWLWWDGPAALVYTPSGAPVYNKRLYTIGQYSRFVRPGWIRLNATTDPAADVQTTVFKDPKTRKFAVVLINYGGSSVTVPIAALKNIASAELFRTSASENLADTGALTPSGKTLSVTLPALSVSTVSGTLAP